ncbi:SAM-dependent methyltransferase [Rhodoligotrophos appendicifer]|uniref:class I SAM-dependent methyltransferase n=1 Tax=Rhodoligotrophos appendicifer TaxID=987056 RepID=UPI00117E680E|nr:class I SAM-dependent methyltransferase [Rhodoligotrophos appendicifer]
MSNPSGSYIIRGGKPGFERLRLLTSVMSPGTRALLQEVGIPEGARVLDLGTGSGGVARELAKRVGPAGTVIALDIDPTQIALAKSSEAGEADDRIEFQQGDVSDPALIGSLGPFDVIYARFLLSHLRVPDEIVHAAAAALAHGGRMIVEDVHFAGHFCHPRSEAFERYVELYGAAARQRGADPDIGISLPHRLLQAGLQDVDGRVSQPAGCQGPVKQIAAVTWQNIQDAVIDGGLVSEDEARHILDELIRLAEDDAVFMTTARVVQAWGRKSS